MALKLVVKTMDLKTGEETSSRLIDYTSREHREWYFRNLIWAANNSHGVQTFSVTDEGKGILADLSKEPGK